MGKIIAIANQKGGVGKTTTTVNLSACLAQMGKRVLVVDSDPQGNTTSGLGLKKRELKLSIYDVLINNCFVTDAIQNTCVNYLQLVPSNIDLAGAEVELVSFEKREFILRKILNDIRFTFDYIIIDCPPSLNILTLNALTAADTVLVPIQCEFYAMEGLTQLLHTIELVKKRLNSDLKLEGIVFTMYDSRTNLSLQVVDEVKKFIDSDIIKSIIPRNVRLSEAPSHGLPITLYDKKSRGAEAYVNLAEEIASRGGI